MKHRVAQEHNMEEEEDEQHVTEYSAKEAEIKHLVDRGLLDGCCMKKQIKENIKSWICKPLTYIETILLCVYQFIVMLSILISVVKFNVIEICLTWVFEDMLPENLIKLVALILNAMLVLELFDEIWQIVFAFLCKCEKKKL